MQAAQVERDREVEDEPDDPARPVSRCPPFVKGTFLRRNAEPPGERRLGALGERSGGLCECRLLGPTGLRLRLAQSATESEDQEADTGEDQSDADDDAEEGKPLGHVRDVQRR